MTITLALHLIRWTAALIGVAIISIGVLKGAWEYVRAILLQRKTSAALNQIRLELGRSIVLGLEFFVAADIMLTILTPDYYEIGILSILVVIRTVLSYFLNQEIQNLTPQE